MKLPALPAVLHTIINEFSHTFLACSCRKIRRRRMTQAAFDLKRNGKPDGSLRQSGKKDAGLIRRPLFQPLIQRSKIGRAGFQKKAVELVISVVRSPEPGGGIL